MVSRRERKEHKDFAPFAPFAARKESKKMNLKKMNKGLDFLREKYGAAKGAITLKDGHCFVGATPLLPGRMERKIVELKKMTENGTLEGVSTLRFAAFAPKGTDMEAMLAKELDLAAYLGASDVVRVMAVSSGSAINVLAKLANDVNVSVEIGAGLPKGEVGYDRHEIIAKRGVACDQTVDTHTPHASIRCYGAKGAEVDPLLRRERRGGVHRRRHGALRHDVRGGLERPRRVCAPAEASRLEGVEGGVGKGDEGRQARVRGGQVEGGEDHRRQEGPRHEPVDKGRRGQVSD